MGEDYTIRVCRSADPRGPYVDKEGHSCLMQDEEASWPGMAPETPLGNYGSAMLLGPEGEQSVPGHPHIWEENGQHYMGYDFRKGPAIADDNSETGIYDYMAIRKLFWVHDPELAEPGYWPTVWQPIDVVYEATAADDGEEL